MMAGSHCCSKVGFFFLHKLFYIPGNHWGGPGCGQCMVFHTPDFGSFGNNIHFSQKVNHTLQCVCVCVCVNKALVSPWWPWRESVHKDKKNRLLESVQSTFDGLFYT